MNIPKEIEFLRAIHKEGVRYLLIGRQALIAYGATVQTMDYDIYIDGGEENTKKLLDVAKRFDLHPTVKLADMKKVFKFRLENTFIIDVFRPRRFVNDQGKRFTFEQLYERRFIIKGKEGLEINLPAIDDLIALKRLAPREKNLIDIQYLKKLKERWRK